MPLVTDRDQLTTILEDIDALPEGAPLAIDTETTGLQVYAGHHLTGISLAYEAGSLPALQSWYVPVAHADSANVPPEGVVELFEALKSTRAEHVYHNGLFDWAAMEQTGLGFEPPPLERYFDTQVFAWLWDENTTHTLKGLGAMLYGEDAKAEKEHLKALQKGRPVSAIYKELRAMDEWKARPAKEAREESHRLKEAGKRTWETFTAADISDYAEKDAELTWRLRDDMVQWMAKDDDPWPAFGRELRLQGAVQRMVRTGVAIDLERVERLRSSNEARMAEIEPSFQGVNMNSPQQLAKLIYVDWGLPIIRRTETGNASTDKETLEELANSYEGVHDEIGLLLEYRKLSKAVGTYYGAMERYADDSGRIHTSFCPTCTVTGRFSSSAPNLQNIPRADTNPEVKKVFVPGDGYELWEYDLASAELRVAASISNETAMMEAMLEEGRDFHNETADGIFGDHELAHRQLAKNLNYGIPYGIGPGKFATYMVKGTGKPVTDREVNAARGIINRHRALYPRLHKSIRLLEKWARKYGWVPLHVEGRYRHFRSAGRMVPYYQAINSVVQGGVAELMKDVMIDLEGPLAELGARMVLQVHDSLWIEVPPGMEEEVERLIQTVTDEINPFRMPMTWDRKQLGVEA